MKTTAKTIGSAGHSAEESHHHHPHIHGQVHDHDEHDHEGHDHDHQTGTGDYVRLGLMGVIVVASLTGWWRPFMSRDWLAFAGTVIGGFPIYKEAWENLRKRRMTMELSMTIALLSALAIGQFFTAIVIAFFVLFAELLEGYTVGGGRRAIENLISTLPYVDQSSITGESLPIEKTEQSKIFAGTINKNGVLEVSVERVGRDTTFGKIIQVVEEAEKSKAPVQKIADRLAAGLVYFALGGAVLTFLITRNLTATIAVIIVAGACGVAAGTPLAILAGIGSAARRGIIVKGGLYLEKLADIDTIVLDKTGTLTIGVPEVTGIRVADGATENEVLENAAIAEQHSEHPIGEAVIRKARMAKVSLRDYSDLQYIPGKGVTCIDRGSKIVVGTRTLLEENGINANGAASFLSRTNPGETLVYVGGGTQILGALSIADQLRSEAVQAVDQLKKQAYRTVLLSGDSSEAAAAIGSQLGVHEAIGNLLPEQKLAKVRELLQQGRKVVMVGDGVNDAPALAEATVGIAMGGGTDVALETADITLMTSDLSRLVEVLSIAKRCYGVIRFNFWGTIAVDTLGIVLAFFGLLAPIIAALIHVGSELAFILNAARLFRLSVRP